MNYNWPQVVVPYRTAKAESLLSAEDASDTSLGFRFASPQADILLTLRVAIRLILRPIGFGQAVEMVCEGRKRPSSRFPKSENPQFPLSFLSFVGSVPLW